MIENLDQGFLNPQLVKQGGPHRFVRQIERLLTLSGFKDIANIDGSGDRGGDIVAVRDNKLYVFQVKWKENSDAAVSVDAVEELKGAMHAYRAHVGYLVTNARISTSAYLRVSELIAAKLTASMKTITGAQLLDWWSRSPDSLPPLDLRQYQEEAFQMVLQDLDSSGRAFLVLATGLGKTVVAGEIVKTFLMRNPNARILLLAHKSDLVQQLESSVWRHLSKHIPTDLIRAETRPDMLRGVIFSTRQSAIEYVRNGFKPDLIVIDEAHNFSENGEYAEIINRCQEVPALGVTATPWRQDEFDVRSVFGAPSFQMGISEAMKLGYLSSVNYRLFIQTADWESIRQLSTNRYSIVDLNRRLFLPQLDERIRDHLIEVLRNTVNPRVIVFCTSIDHAERMKDVLSAVWADKVSTIHTRNSSRENSMNLANFRLGRSTILVSVDMLNEGIDVPDVNILVFARVTHSRKIFVQQLGRGLRVAPHKSHVEVLDFVTDVRRFKAVSEIRRGIEGGNKETLYVNPGTVDYVFSNRNQNLQEILSDWIEEASDLDTQPDDYELTFPRID